MTNTPMPKVFSAPLKTPLNKSSRKAFGNVSNVLSSKQSIAAKAQSKVDHLAKESQKLVEDSKLDLKSNEMKSISAEVETVCKENSKFMDEIESMFPNESELMSEMNDPISPNMFAIDERTVFEMQFDPQMTECLVRPKDSNINFDDLF